MAGYNSYSPQYQNLSSMPLNYNYQIPQFQNQLQPQQSQADNGIAWVQGEANAKSTFVEPGKSKLMIDSEQDVFYIKTVDISGMPLPLRVFDFVERGVKSQNKEPKTERKKIEYVKKDELEGLVSEIMKKKLRGNKSE